MRPQKTKPRALAFALLLAVFAACSISAAKAPSAAGAIRLGAHIKTEGTVGAPTEASALDNFSSIVGESPAIVMNYSSPTEALLTPVEIANLEAGGETPMITWQLYKSGWSGPGMSLEGIAQGQYDESFRQAARLARSLPFEVMIRPGHEMNGDWYPWSGDPSAYVAAWRHMVSVFREEDADNVKWVWSPNVEYNTYPFAAYFPGDEWVDYVGLDGYNWGTAGIGTDRWESLDEVFAASYERITALSSKPVILAEVASGETGGNKAQWIRTGFLKTIPEKFPRVAAVIWFDYDKEEDWRVNSSPEALQAYREVAESPLYGGAGAAGPAEATGPLKVLELELTTNPLATSGAEAPAAAPVGAGPVKVLELEITTNPPAASGGEAPASAPVVAAYRLSKKAKVKLSVRRVKKRHRAVKGKPVVVRSTIGGRRRSKVRLSKKGRLGGGSYVLTMTARSGGHVAQRNIRFRLDG